MTTEVYKAGTCRGSRATSGRALIVAIYLIIIASNVWGAGWSQTDGPYGGIIESLTGDDTFLFAGTYGFGISRSANSGEHWVTVNDGLPPYGYNGSSLRVHGIAVIDTIVLAGTNGGLNRSVDCGDTWTVVDVGSHWDNVVVYDFAYTDTSILAGSSDGVYRSTDDGITWVEPSEGLKSFTISMLQFNDAVYAGTLSSVYRSDDDGLTWTEVGDGLPGFTYINDLTLKDSVLFAATNGYGVYASTDGGERWVARNTGMEQGSVYSMGASDTYVFAGLWDGVYRSADDGLSWTKLSNGLTNTSAEALYLRNDTLFAGTMGGTYRSLDNGDSWTRISDGMAPIGATCFAPLGSMLIAGTARDGLFLKSDAGNTWTPISGGLADADLEIRDIVVHNGVVYIGTSRGVYRTSDTGQHWTKISTGLTSTNIFDLAANNSYVLAATNGGGMCRLPIDGDTWEEINNGFPHGVAYSVVVHDGSVLASGDYVYRSTDNGDSWEKTSDGLAIYGVTTLGTSASYMYAGSKFYNDAESRGVYRSADNGGSWAQINVGLPSEAGARTVNGIASDGALIYLSTDRGAYISEDYGTYWSSLGSPLAEYACGAIGVVNSTVFVSEGRTVWHLDTPTAVEEESDELLPSSFYLAHNYPNPFNPVTTIEYSLPQGSSVRIDIFNLLGQQVRTLLDYKQPAGSYTITWDGTNTSGQSVSTGIYFYRFQADDHVETKKMLLLK